MPKSAEEQQTKAREEEKKQRKKMARREAILMLKLEEARKEVKRAEQKVSKAQVGLEGSQTALQDVEQELAELRGTTAKPQGEGAQEGTPDQDSERDKGDMPSEEQVEGPPPVEGRVDITEPPVSQESSSEAVEPVVIASGGSSMTLESSDEHAWPPPEIRAEVAEAAQEEPNQPLGTEESAAEDQEGESGENEEAANDETLFASRTRRRSSRRSHPSS